MPQSWHFQNEVCLFCALNITGDTQVKFCGTPCPNYNLRGNLQKGSGFLYLIESISWRGTFSFCLMSSCPFSTSNLVKTAAIGFLNTPRSFLALALLFSFTSCSRLDYMHNHILDPGCLEKLHQLA